MRTLNSLQMPSKRLIASYVFDWFIILCIAAVGGGFNRISPFHRPFSLIDLTISYPHVDETIPTWLLLVVCLIAPGIIIFVVCMFFIPGPTKSPSTPKLLIWRRKFWEWNSGWMGLGLSLATTFLITEGMKNIWGKPRPDLISRCDPDIANLRNYVVGGYGQDISDKWVLVNWLICRSTNSWELDDGFRSFPSGHASFSWAGMLYLSLFLASKFAIAIPFLPPRGYSQNEEETALDREQRLTLPAFRKNNSGKKLSNDDNQNLSDTNAVVPIRNQAAAPPTWILVLGLIPIGTAIYITSTRYTDFRHHPIDLFFGSLIGILCAYSSFRWYHLPIRQGAGWAWGARTRNRAFGIGVGIGNYVGTEGWGPASSSRATDLENGHSRVDDMTGPSYTAPREPQALHHKEPSSAGPKESQVPYPGR
ncbi:PAP2-domain-containing protein [Patellaria atrata CBS 101060]|uniref:PAP2-domain-containing protein n=1 Tax=Patellaria atrata CBS 101060 TaxID=1346257 RepID=A0A9P4SIG1_9PEZI|nr:PAP2-domain-containing protein [Patellaria atrata CBS 101060]